MNLSTVLQSWRLCWQVFSHINSSEAVWAACKQQCACHYRCQHLLSLVSAHKDTWLTSFASQNYPRFPMLFIWDCNNFVCLTSVAFLLVDKSRIILTSSHVMQFFLLCLASIFCALVIHLLVRSFQISDVVLLMFFKMLFASHELKILNLCEF